MVSKFTLLSSLSLASVALAVSFSLGEDSFTRGHEDCQSRSISRVTLGADPASGVGSMAGAILASKNNGTFAHITGKFTIPTIQGPDGSGSALLAIDDSRCEAYIFADISFKRKNGRNSFHAWHQRYPSMRNPLNDDELTINVGNRIAIHITTSSAGSTTVNIKNHTTSKNVMKDLTDHAHHLCHQHAGWVVGEDETGSIIDFGTMTFTGAAYSESHHKVYYLSNATLMNINWDTAELTSDSVFTDRHAVTIKYV